MDNIIEPNKNFDFSKLSLAHPVGIQGGAYFTKILYNNKPLYIQTTKSLTRQGFVKSGKKYYCDLMFDNNSETLIHWFENLEETCQKLIFDKSEAWFQNSLDKNDVESAFNSVIRIYKSGKYYLVRTNIKIGSNNEPSVKIYSENEIPLTIDDVKDNTNIISILEIQGIKFTSRNFQIDIELRQTMVLDNEPIFDNCLIKTNNSNKNTILNQDIKKQNDSLVKDSESINEPNDSDIAECNNAHEASDAHEATEAPDTTDSDDTNDTSNSTNINQGLGLVGLDLELDLGKEINTTNNIVSQNDKNCVHDNGDDNVINFDIQELVKEELEHKTELKEIDLNNHLEDDLERLDDEPITLKKPNEVYYELYKEAREKAKLAKKSAIIAYLEAKNIRKTYMLDNLDESESDIDAEIDEVSESELEDL
uniref:Uncharacterized protein n=1 Tax=viral metagenome TaxID=1070528 RepID=A0A6C0D6X1_9ZZZZ